MAQNRNQNFVPYLVVVLQSVHAWLESAVGEGFVDEAGQVAAGVPHRREAEPQDEQDVAEGGR
ncbi:hypothetical protein AVEN_107638-1, partial [Araneus ventricosus]